MTCAIVIRACRRGPSASATWQAIWQCNDIHVTVTSRQPEEFEYDLGGSIWGGSCSRQSLFQQQTLLSTRLAPIRCTCAMLGSNTCPIRVMQSGATSATLVMTGPWVAADHGVNANGVVVDKDSLPSATILLASRTMGPVASSSRTA